MFHQMEIQRMTANASNTTRTIQRMRHEARSRVLTVSRVTRLTPHMTRITLTGPLEGFVSAAADDHVKLFFPLPGGTEPVFPNGPPGSPQAANGPAPIMRDYTPRRYDPVSGELDIEFVLHEEGPATAWASQAKPGDLLGIGGPRGSFVLRGEFDWYLLIADESGLPALARRLEELPSSAQALVVAEVADASEELPLSSAAALKVTWVHRSQPAGDAAALLNAVSSLRIPPGVGYSWIACESNVARALRQHLVNERGLDKQWVKAAGYWKRGVSATHEKHED